ncbi:MAG: phospholipase, partial [Actinobacteria bacterium]
MSRRRTLLVALQLLLVVGLFVGAGFAGHADAKRKPKAPPARGIHKIKHVIVIMQENRSFDSYFGTFPGADGIPANVCVPDPAKGGCQRPCHDPNDLNAGGPHGQANAIADVAGGAMNGFVAQAERGRKGCKRNPNNPACSQRFKTPDVMGYHDAQEIPNYWAYAKSFVLQDRMFEPNASWSLPAHLFMVSEWSARCSIKGDPMSCTNALQSPGPTPDQQGNTQHIPPDYAWTDLTYLFYKHKVSWRYYVFTGT